MWRLLSGIALILLLDIAFIWMMSSEPDAPELARSVGPTAAAPIIHEQPIAPLQIEDSTSPDVEPEDATPEKLRTARRRAVRATRVFNDRTKTIAATSPANLFPDRIIWIGRTEVPGKSDRDPIAVRTKEGDAIVSRETTDEPPLKKRSFESKAIRVIKKPYELIKAFADKFN